MFLIFRAHSPAFDSHFKKLNPFILPYYFSIAYFRAHGGSRSQVPAFSETRDPASFAMLNPAFDSHFKKLNPFILPYYFSIAYFRAFV